ncbi:MAG TPA: hypothetical protein VGM90_09745 [Kofleriaceae bacterium]|jgi:hypothetical protein
MKKFSLVLLSVMALGACGGDDGGSGIASSKLVKDLTPAEGTALCHSLASDWPARSVTCSGEMTTIGVADSDCSSASGDPIGDVPAGCTATVGDAEACFTALGNVTDMQYCSGTFTPPASCSVILSSACDTGSGSGSAAAAPAQGTRERLDWLAGRARMLAGY